MSDRDADNKNQVDTGIDSELASSGQVPAAEAGEPATVAIPTAVAPAAAQAPPVVAAAPEAAVDQPETLEMASVFETGDEFYRPAWMNLPAPTDDQANESLVEAIKVAVKDYAKERVKLGLG
jgi:hypothetical protein